MCIGMFSESGVLNKISWVFSLQQGLVWHPGAATLTWLSDYDKHLVTGIGLSFLHFFIPSDSVHHLRRR